MMINPKSLTLVQETLRHIDPSIGATPEAITAFAIVTDTKRRNLRHEQTLAILAHLITDPHWCQIVSDRVTFVGRGAAPKWASGINLRRIDAEQRVYQFEDLADKCAMLVKKNTPQLGDANIDIIRRQFANLESMRVSKVVDQANDIVLNIQQLQQAGYAIISEAQAPLFATIKNLSHLLRDETNVVNKPLEDFFSSGASKN